MKSLATAYTNVLFNKNFRRTFKLRRTGGGATRDSSNKTALRWSLLCWVGYTSDTLCSTCGPPYAQLDKLRESKRMYRVCKQADLWTGVVPRCCAELGISKWFRLWNQHLHIYHPIRMSVVSEYCKQINLYQHWTGISLKTRIATSDCLCKNENRNRSLIVNRNTARDCTFVAHNKSWKLFPWKTRLLQKYTLKTSLAFPFIPKPSSYFLLRSAIMAHIAFAPKLVAMMLLKT